MATLSKTSSGRWVVQFKSVIGKGRKTISLGSVDDATANTIRAAALRESDIANLTSAVDATRGAR